MVLAKERGIDNPAWLGIAGGVGEYSNHINNAALLAGAHVPVYGNSGSFNSVSNTPLIEFRGLDWDLSFDSPAEDYDLDLQELWEIYESSGMDYLGLEYDLDSLDAEYDEDFLNLTQELYAEEANNSLDIFSTREEADAGLYSQMVDLAYNSHFETLEYPTLIEEGVVTIINDMPQYESEIPYLQTKKVIQAKEELEEARLENEGAIKTPQHTVFEAYKAMEVGMYTDKKYQALLLDVLCGEKDIEDLSDWEGTELQYRLACAEYDSDYWDAYSDNWSVKKAHINKVYADVENEYGHNLDERGKTSLLGSVSVGQMLVPACV